MKIERRDIKIVDCTLRDGGYYNAWDFDLELVTSYLNAMAQSRVDIVELGFRSFLSDGFFGAHAYTTDVFLDGLNIPPGVALGVMVNAKDVIQHPAGTRAAIDLLFQPRAKSKVELVRIAAHAREAEASLVAIHRLYELGYRVGFNVMQAGEIPSERLTEVARMMKGAPIEVLYFADSLGNMTRDDLKRVTAAFRGGWDGPLGCHTHDNISRALDNSIAALEEGAAWIDATVLGMGRGPGNARTEFLLLELQRAFGMEVETNALIDLVCKYFLPMQHKYGWGPHPFYFLSGMRGIHPTYVQELMSDLRYQTADVIGVLDTLGQAQSASYRSGSLQDALRFYSEEVSGTWAARGWSQGRPILLVASGASVKRHLPAIKNFIRDNSPLVLVLNKDTGLPPELVTAMAVCHPTRLAMDASSYDAAIPVVVPYGGLPEALRIKLQRLKVLDFGLKVEGGRFAFGDYGCVVPTALVAAYALAIAASAGAPKIFLAGFDGYKNGDARQNDMVNILENYLATAGAVPLVAITPTSYPIPQASVYDPALS